jgi:hypothetical protein
MYQWHMSDGRPNLFADMVKIAGWLSKFLLFVLLTILLERLAYHLAYFFSLSSWIVVPFGGASAWLAYQHSAVGWRFLRLRHLRGATLAAAIMFAVTMVNNPHKGGEAQMEGKVDRLVAAYARLVDEGRSVIVEADDILLEAASHRLPPALVAGEKARRQGIKVAMHEAEAAAERQAREEQRRREDAFAKSPVGQLLTVLAFGLWLLGLAD